jgi:hypothetical protein
LRNREAIPPAHKTSRSSSVAVGESVRSVYVPGNETATWTEKERRERWKKAREGAMYAGVVSAIDHNKQILNVDFEDGDKAIGVPFNLVKFPDGQFFDEAMSMEHRRSSAKRRKLTPSKKGYKWRHGGVHRMRFTEAAYDDQPFPESMILSNTYDLLINGKWQKQTDLEHVSLKDAINHPDLADVYTVSIWEFAQDMYYKQPKKEEHGYHFGTVDVLPKQSQKRLAEIEQCYAKARD